jgi:hypothetical protein
LKAPSGSLVFAAGGLATGGRGALCAGDRWAERGCAAPREAAGEDFTGVPAPFGAPAAFAAGAAATVIIAPHFLQRAF